MAYHVFDKHDNCGSFCRHLKNEIIFQHINKLFSDLADNANKFVLAGLTQAYESLNNSMASYCPKSISYSTSESADYRFACVVARKNLDSDYILKIFEKLNLSYPKKLIHYCNYALKKSN